MTLYIENPICTTKKLLKIINEFSKVAGYKISVQKYVAFLYTDNKLSERNKRNPNLKRSKLSLFADGMILYTENPKDATRKLL